MTHHDIPFVVSLIWLAALSGGLIFLLLREGGGGIPANVGDNV